jgi:hypothetical protein
MIRFTPGMQSSEFAVTVITAVLDLLNNSQGWVTFHQALIPNLAALAYVLSRGFAKTEIRGGSPPNVPPSA